MVALRDTGSIVLQELAVTLVPTTGYETVSNSPGELSPA